MRNPTINTRLSEYFTQLPFDFPGVCRLCGNLGFMVSKVTCKYRKRYYTKTIVKDCPQCTKK